jgi:NAD(P)-dependent dehydrogenase (short-subunit alcohol dehydrogenase family)
MISKRILITGASRGLGLEIARICDRQLDADLILAVRNPDSMMDLAAEFRRPPQIVQLDVGEMDEISEFSRAWSGKLDVLINNAGLQISGPATFTREGIEETIAVNHLGPLHLSHLMLPHLSGGTVMGIGSGTHNPRNPMARAFGFRGGKFSSISELAAGASIFGRSGPQDGMDRYATSKLLSMASTVELARRFPDVDFVNLDPGMMPGTGLLRSGPAVARLAWATLLRVLVPILPDTSTPKKSAKAALDILRADDRHTGSIYDFNGRPSRLVAPNVRDASFGQRVVDESLDFLARF